MFDASAVQWASWDGPVTDDTGEIALARLDAVDLSESFTPPGTVPEHDHPCWSLAYLVSGQLVEHSEHGARLFSAGSMSLLPPGWRHWLEVGAQGAHAVRLRWPGQAQSEGSRIPPLVYAAGEKPLRALLELLDHAAGGSSRLAADCALAELLRWVRQPPRRGDGERRRIEAVFERLGEDPAAEPTLDALAESAGLSRSHFCREFRACFGVSPGEAQRCLRLQRALTLLRGSTLGLEAIARGSGFADAAQLSRSCRRLLGCAPQQLRGSIAERA